MVHFKMPTLPPIMILDDDADDLFFVRRLLTKAEIRNDVVSFENPLGAIDHLEREAKNPNPLFIPCAIITDLNMPRKSGLEFIQWVRGHEMLRTVRMILFTDSQDPAEEQKALAAGANAFARKFPSTDAFAAMLGDLPCVHP